MEVVLANAQKEFPELEQIEPLNSNEKDQWNSAVYVRKNYVLCAKGSETEFVLIGKW